MPYTHYINTKQVMHWIQFQSYQPPVNLDHIAGFSKITEENCRCIQFITASGCFLDWEYDDESTCNEDYQTLIEMVLHPDLQNHPIRSNSLHTKGTHV